MYNSPMAGGLMTGWGTAIPQAALYGQQYGAPVTAAPMSPMPTAAQLSANALPPGAGLPSATQSGWLGNSGLGANIGTAQLALSGLNTIGNLWAAFEARKMAKEQFNYTKSVTNTNLANSIKSYNTALADRARARGFTEGQSQQEIDAYVASNQARRG